MPGVKKKSCLSCLCMLPDGFFILHSHALDASLAMGLDGISCPVLSEFCMSWSGSVCNGQDNFHFIMKMLS